MIKLIDRIFSSIEARTSIKRINWIKTLYVNFRLLPFSLAVKMPLLCYGKLKIASLQGEIIFPDRSIVKRGIVRIGVDIVSYRASRPSAIRILKGGKIIINGSVRISQGASIVIGENATLSLGNNLMIGDNSEIICKCSISIGDFCRIAWETQITDFGSHFIMDINTGIINNIFKPVVLGHNCWIGNRNTIQPGTILPDNTIAASNSILNKNYIALGIKPYSIIGGAPAKLIKKDMKRIYDTGKELTLLRFFSESGLDFISDTGNNL